MKLTVSSDVTGCVAPMGHFYRRLSRPEVSPARRIAPKRYTTRAVIYAKTVRHQSYYNYFVSGGNITTTNEWDALHTVGFLISLLKQAKH